MKIISWNVNSVRARIENIKNYIKDSDPDVLLLQEIKTQNENFPNDELKNLGYLSYVYGQKSYNGVAIISKNQLKKDPYGVLKRQEEILFNDIAPSFEIRLILFSLGKKLPLFM